MSMKPENVTKLERYRFVLNSRSFTPSPGYSLYDVLDVIRDEWEPNHEVDWHCYYCIMQMIEFAFDKMDRHISTQTIHFER